jgi:hypothetical protein
MIRIQASSERQNNPPVSSVNEIKLSPADREFIDRVSNRVTMFGMIPYNIPERAYIELIKSAARYFYKFDSKTWTRRVMYYMDKDIRYYINDVASERQPAQTSGITFNFGIQLDKSIVVVRAVTEAKQRRAQELTEAMDLTTYGGTAGAIGINNNLFVIERACVSQERKVFDSVFKSTVIFDYTSSTAFLTIFNKSRENLSLMLDVEKMVQIDALYQDSYFERYLIAAVKRELKRVIAGHVFEFPGGVTMNADEICNNIDDVEKIEELLKNGGGIGDIILKR